LWKSIFGSSGGVTITVVEAKRVSADRVALRVEGVVDGGVGSEEAVALKVAGRMGILQFRGQYCPEMRKV
jgi:hypothetical protein